MSAPLSPEALPAGAAAAPRVPEPPVALPPGRLVHVPGVGELFLRDSGGPGPPVLLLHGWMFSSDLNWFRAYRPLIEAGYRVLAVDHRGHGHGLRSPEPFRLEDCAADAAALMLEIDAGPVLATGYSMGGPIASLMARDHPDTVAGVVLAATAQEWQDPRTRLFWRAMGALRVTLGLFPHEAWRQGLKLSGFPENATTTWVTSELTRGSGRDLAEAGRELGRYDSRPWIADLAPPAVVVVTARDTSVPPDKQRALAEALGAPTYEFPGDHAAVTAQGREFARTLLEALGDVAARAGLRPAPARA